MRLVTKSALIFFVACSSLSLTACGHAQHGGEATTTPASKIATTKTDDAHGSQHEGHTGIHDDIAHAEIIMSGPYHLELIAESKDYGINLNFHLEDNASQKPILGAKVTAVVQKPNGNQEILDLQYEAGGEHYIGSLETDAVGFYEVAILTDIKGKIVNANFSFER